MVVIVNKSFVSCNNLEELHDIFINGRYIAASENSACNRAGPPVSCRKPEWFYRADVPEQANYSGRPQPSGSSPLPCLMADSKNVIYPCKRLFKNLFAGFLMTILGCKPACSRWCAEFLAIEACYDCKIRLVSLKNSYIINSHQ